MEQADVIIIGGGISGLMSAYRIQENKPELKIVMLEKGMDINNRQCPIVAKKVNTCIHCPSCGIMEGLMESSSTPSPMRTSAAVSSEAISPQIPISRPCKWAPLTAMSISLMMLGFRG